MKFKFFFLTAIALCCASFVCAQQGGLQNVDCLTGLNAEKMKSEADIFIRSLPAGRQTYQAEAIREALKGDFTALMQVRNSRNITSELPDGVSAKYLNEKIKLYYPSDLKEEEHLPCLIYLHGGCWVFGSINSCARYCGELCRKYRIVVAAIDYALAPSFPYPYALNEIMQCSDIIFNNAASYGVDAGRISIGGDSAGGNLAIVAALQRKQQKQQYASLVLFYPVVKAWDDGSESWRLYGKNAGLDADLMDISNKAYIGKSHRHNPEISPAMYSDDVLKTLPKTLCVAADRDILRDQGKEFADRLHKLGVDVKYCCLQGTFHLFITVDGQEEAFSQSVRLSGEFLNQTAK